MSEARHAEERHGWWPGWIWSIPIAALGLVSWLAVRTWTQTGPTVTVVFPVIADLRPDDTDVVFEGYKVGQVASVRLTPDLRHMRAKLDLNGDMRGHIGKGTAFWIIGRSLSLSHLSDIRSLVSGVKIGVKPVPGEPQAEYRGLADSPVLHFGESGTPFVLHAAELGAMEPGTPVYFLGKTVGVVQKYDMVDGRGFAITVFVDAPFDRFVHEDSRFWRAGPLHVATGGDGMSVRFQSVPALFQGAVAFETPNDTEQSREASAGHDFTLYDGENEARTAPDADWVSYRVVFRSAAGVPRADAPVMLMGQRIGSVGSSVLQFDPAARQLQVIATIMLEPRAIRLANAGRWSDRRRQMDDMLRSLIGQGLHATLENSPPLIGGEQIVLRMMPGTPGTLGTGDVPEIPTTPGGGISGLVAGANDVVSELAALPLGRIAGNLAEVSDHLSHITGSPMIAATLHHVDRATEQLQHVSEQLDRQMPPAVAAVRKAVGDAQHALEAAAALLSEHANAAEVPGSADLPQTLYEISRAARALREFSDFIDRHPSAVLTGRGPGG